MDNKEQEGGKNLEGIGINSSKNTRRKKYGYIASKLIKARRTKEGAANEEGTFSESGGKGRLGLEGKII